MANLNYYCIVSAALSTLNCRSCRGPLDIHQPNPNQPDQFLGTCSDCNLWYRVESKPGEGRLTVMQLPEVAETRAPTSDPYS